jgi:formamidopyrimidine-DNA glycosylase
MPEGPEVLGLVDSINHFLGKNALLEKVEIVSGRYTKSPIVGIESVEHRYPLLIRNIGCKGKLIHINLVSENNTPDSQTIVLMNTLGLSGGWTNREVRNTRVKLHTSKGVLYFCDSRNFGTLKFATQEQLNQKLGSLGPDILKDEISLETFIQRMNSKKKGNLELCQALMDQSIVSGVGNYLKADSLWLSGLSPYRKVKDCSSEEMFNLLNAIQVTSKSSYLSGGSTILTYLGFDQEAGKHHLLCYGRKTDPKGNQIICEDTSDGRTTWWAPAVQK